MTDMTEADLNAVLSRLKQDGFKTSLSGKKHAKASRADLRLVHVLWRKLGEAGQLRDPSRKGLNKFIRARFENAWSNVPADVDMMRDHAEIDQVIQALKSWGRGTRQARTGRRRVPVRSLGFRRLCGPESHPVGGRQKFAGRPGPLCALCPIQIRQNL